MVKKACFDALGHLHDIECKFKDTYHQLPLAQNFFEVCAACRYLCNCVNMLQVVEQYHGDMIYIPPGWAHQVYNHRPCTKLAWDYIVLDNMQKYALSARHVACHLPQSADYMNMSRVLKNFIRSPTKV